MNNKKFDNYKYFVYQKDDGSTVVKAESTYCGKRVHGIAKCSPDDEFNLESGMKLAAARCNLKVAERRYKRACTRLTETKRILDFVQNEYNDAKNKLDEFGKMLKDALAEEIIALGELK